MTLVDSTDSTAQARGERGAPTTSPATYWALYEAPIGEILLVADETGLRELHLPGSHDGPGDDRTDDRVEAGVSAPLDEALEQLGAYFAGELTTFELPLVPRGTSFQQQVWWALADIPYARTESYGSVAKRIGNPRASRAVGMANNKNPLPIVLPCHRVIGSDGRLVGYGGGLWMKEWLLRHEATTAERTGALLGL